MTIKKNKYRKNLGLLFTETDSLVYEIETKNVWDDFSENKEIVLVIILVNQTLR